MTPTIGFVVGHVASPTWGFVIGMLIIVSIAIAVWIGATIQAPVKQRNELREMYAQTAAAHYGAAYERYIYMLFTELQSFLSQPTSGHPRIRHETGRILVEWDDGRVFEFTVQPPGVISRREITR